MKKVNSFLASIVLSMVILVGCQKDTSNSYVSAETAGGGVNTTSNKPPAPPVVCNSNAYVITLESTVYLNGEWVWTWSVTNPNPGNGTNGTSQDMSHWGMQFGDCFDWADVKSASYSADNISWTSFTPEYKVDPSQTCVGTPVLKYNMGTSGTAKSYYQLVLSKNYAVGISAGYYKSGVRMPCCTFTFTGVGCPQEIPLCAYSQGFWFAKPQTVWCQNVTFGANSYTQIQGKTIWTDAPANSVAKKAFTQASAVQLNKDCIYNGAPVPAAISSAYTTIVNFLSGLTYNDILNGEYKESDYPEIQAAAGAIGSWIDANHCEE